MDAAKQLIAQEFHFLEKLGFRVTFNQQTNDVFIESFDAEYLDNERSRKIKVGYTKGMVHGVIRYTFTASIVRIPYNGSKDYYVVNVYLRSLNKDFFANIEGNFDEGKAKKILKKLSDVMKNDAYQIVLGSEWIEGYWSEW